MANPSMVRINKELHDMEKSSDLSISVAHKDSDIRHVRALIIGPPDTPYEFGFFEFSVRFGKEYPTKAPAVQAITTNAGRTRFNPNIYAAGKVCLSILGTWRGERGEEWSSAQGLESILISIQSLMSGNPYENEPGFEDAHSDGDKRAQQAYIAKIRHETLRISIIDRLEDYLGISKKSKISVYNADTDYASNAFDTPFEPFADKCKRRFLWYYDSYISAIDTESRKHKDGNPFEKMPFEGPSNSMDGGFTYGTLRTRIQGIRDKLHEEMSNWAEEGKKAVLEERNVAVNLQRQFDTVVEIYKKSDAVSLDLELVDKNPFVWSIHLYGRPMTNLDGGIFRIKIYLSPRFPTEQPRVKVETPLFHHRISSAGHLCYLVRDRVEDMRVHVQAILAAIEDDKPAYDPRTLVNPEASKLFWGSAEDKKMYNRKLRRSVQDSSEYVDGLPNLMDAANIPVR